MSMRLDQHDPAQGDGGRARVLRHDEDQRGQGLAAVERRVDECIADKAADRLDLVVDDRRDLGGLMLRMRLRGPKLSSRLVLRSRRRRRSRRSPSLPLRMLMAYLNRAVDQHEQQGRGPTGQRDRKAGRAGRPGTPRASRPARPAGSARCGTGARSAGHPGRRGPAVHPGDDEFGELEGEVIEGEGQADDDQQDDLFAPTSLQMYSKMPIMFFGFERHDQCAAGVPSCG